MKNFEKYEEEVKKHDYNFAFDFKNKKIVNCMNINCSECMFCNECSAESKIKWLYEEYNSKAQLTIEEIEELLKNKYPNGIEVVE